MDDAAVAVKNEVGGKLNTSTAPATMGMPLPVVVIVHGNQEPHAWATILWDNAFAGTNPHSLCTEHC